MKKLTFISFLSLLTLTYGGFLQARGGSDGPTPFMRVPAPKKIKITLEKGVSSFAFLEGSERLVYVDTEKQFRVFNLRDGQEKRMPSYIRELSPFSDSEGKYVFSKDLKNLKRLDVTTDVSDVRLFPAQKFLFWNNQHLFLLKSLEKIAEHKWNLIFFDYDAAKNLIRTEQCQFTGPAQAKALKVAEGHFAPKVTLYHDSFVTGNSRLSTYSLELKPQNGKCHLEVENQFQDEIKGQILSVSTISAHGDLAIITDHASSNLYLGKNDSISCANLPSGINYIPNPSSAVAINLNRQKGIGVYSLRTGKYFTLNLSVDRGLFEGNQIWIDSDAQRLIFSTKDYRDKQGGRALYSVSLKELN